MSSSYILPVLGIVVALGYFGLTGGFGSPSSQKTYGGKHTSRYHNRNKNKNKKRYTMKHK